MKKNKKIFLISLSILLILLICGGGIYMGHKECQKVKEEVVMGRQEEQLEEKKEMIRTIKKLQPQIDAYVRQFDKNHVIKNITIEYGTAHIPPVKGIVVDGYVNNDKSLDFRISIGHNTVDDNGELMYTIDTYSPSDKLGKLEGDE